MPHDAKVETGYLTLGNDYEALKLTGGALAMITLDPRETGVIIIHADAVGTPSDDIDIVVLQGIQLKTGDTLDAGAVGSADLDTVADAIAADDDLNGTYLAITSGNEEGTLRLITDSANANDRVTPSHNWGTGPTAGDSYERYALGYTHEVKLDLGGSATPDSDDPHHIALPVDAVDGRYVFIMARRDGTTDAHRVRAAYQTDGVNA